MVAADRARQTGRDADDDHRRDRAGFRHIDQLIAEHAGHDRDEDAECAPGGSGRECQCDRNDKQDHRQQDLERLCALHNAGDKFTGREQIRHGFQRPRKGQDQDRRDHLLKALRDGIHALRKGQDAAAEEIDDDEQQCPERADRQTERCIAVRKGFDKARPAEEAARIDHAGDAERDQHDDRQDQVDDFSAVMLRLCILRIDLAARCEKVAPARIVLMLFHRAVINIAQRDENDHDERQQRIEIIGDRADEQRDAVDAADRSCYSRRP